MSKLRQIAKNYAVDELGHPDARIAGMVVARNAALALVSTRRDEFVLLLERGAFDQSRWAVTEECSDPEDFYRNGGVADADLRSH